MNKLEPTKDGRHQAVAFFRINQERAVNVMQREPDEQPHDQVMRLAQNLIVDEQENPTGQLVPNAARVHFTE